MDEIATALLAIWTAMLQRMSRRWRYTVHKTAPIAPYIANAGQS